MMKIRYSNNFQKMASNLPDEPKNKLKIKLDLIIHNPNHSSLNTRKIEGQKDIYESSIDDEYRVTWQPTGKGPFLRNIMKRS